MICPSLSHPHLFSALSCVFSVHVPISAVCRASDPCFPLTLSVLYGSVSQPRKPADQKLSHQNVHVYQGFLTLESELIAALCVYLGFCFSCTVFIVLQEMILGVSCAL